VNFKVTEPADRDSISVRDQSDLRENDDINTPSPKKNSEMEKTKTLQIEYGLDNNSQLYETQT